MASRIPIAVDGDEVYELDAGPWAADGSTRTRLESGVEVRLPGAIPGERHRVRIVHRSEGAQVHYAQSLELLSVAGQQPLRRSPPCPIHDSCGACGIQHVQDTQQLRLKASSALSLLPDSLQQLAAAAESQAGAGPSFGYRHKAVFLPELQGERLLLGGFARGSHDVVDLPDCAVLAPALVTAREQLVTALLGPLAASPSRISTPGSAAPASNPGGSLRSVIARANRGGEVLVCAVVTELAAREWLEGPLAALVQGSGPVVGCSMQVFASPGDSIAGTAAALHLCGETSIHEHIGEARLQLHPLSFFQVNPFALERLCALIRERLPAHAERPLRLLDLYCGGGALGLAVAAAAAGEVSLSGLDIDPRAIASARQDALASGIDAAFEAGSAAQVLPSLVARRGPFDVVIVDPPRRGLRSEAVAEILQAGAPLLLYVSCHSPSLARDAPLLEAGGYRAVGLWPVDMLPQTPHMEWLAAFAQVPSTG